MTAIGEAALGVLCEQLTRRIIAVAEKVRDFRPSFDRLRSSLETITPVVREIESFNKELDKAEEMKSLRDTIDKAGELIERCSKVSKFNFWNKARYTSKINGIAESIQSFCQIAVQLQQLRDLKKTLHLLERGRSCRGGGSELMGVCSAPEISKPIFGLDGQLIDLKRRLLHDKQQVIVVSAPAGCGKTTLAAKLCHDDDIKGKFKKILYVPVSKTPNLGTIVQNMFRHNEYDVPEFPNDSSIAIRLGHLLTAIGRDPLLLVLDDVWYGAESFIEKFKLQIPDYKILVTSRHDFPCFGPPFKLKGLKSWDAMALFTENTSRPQGISDTEVQKIVEACKGVPLFLKVVGRSLSGKPADTWKSRLKRISDGGSVIDADAEIPECLNSCMDDLETTDKELYECFMDLGAFPEDHRIWASSIVDMWLGLYDDLFDEGVHAMDKLHSLSYRNLLDLFNAGIDQSDGFYNGYFVTQHDLLRELAIRRGSNEAPVEERSRLFIEINGNKAPNGFEKQPIMASLFTYLKQLITASFPARKTRLLSISTDDSFSSTWPDIQVSEAEVLVLNLATQDYALPGFLGKMNQLKVLMILNHNFSTAKPGNLSLIASLPNLKRLRLEKIEIASLDMACVQLKNLQKISLVMCDISEAFQRGPVHASQALPSLVEIDIDYCKNLEELPRWICCITSLKTLSITNCRRLLKLSEAIGDVMSLETLRLTSCFELCELPETIGKLWQLSYLDISGCLGLTKLPENIGELQGLRKLCMSKCSIGKLPESVKNLKDLKVVCDEETESLWRLLDLQKRNVKVEGKDDVPTLGWLWGGDAVKI